MKKFKLKYRGIECRYDKNRIEFLLEHDDWPDSDEQYIIGIGGISIPETCRPEQFVMAAKVWIDCFLGRESRLSPRKIFHVSFICHIDDIDAIQMLIETGLIERFKLIHREISRAYLKWASADDHEVKLEFRKLSAQEIEDLEEELVINPNPDTIQSIHQFKREMIALRKSVWPIREVILKLMREGSDFVEERTDLYLRDVYDHTIQVIDTIETYRDLLSGMLDIYLSSMSNRMNEIMKLLTLIGTIFIPLSFITGLYGMNFKTDGNPLNMPELGWSFGYIYVWIVMLAVVFTMLFYFRKKKWI